MDPLATGPVAFHTTRWSLVTGAAGEPVQGRAALEELCAAYWPPLYAFLRRRGHSPDAAQDLVQAFFLRVLEKEWLGQADPARGRFRTFLLAALKHFVSNERARADASKRGGGRVQLPLDGVGDEEGGLHLADASETPDAAFERRYAEALLERALARLAHQERGSSEERAQRFDVLQPMLWGEGPSQSTASEALGTSETALRVALHRLRRRLAEAIRAEVADTVTDPSDVDAEIQSLIAALRRP